MIPTLVKRLEEATGPSRTLDAMIHRVATPEFADMLTKDELPAAAEGWLVGGNHKQPEWAPRYTESIDVALRLFADEGTAVRATWGAAQYVSSGRQPTKFDLIRELLVRALKARQETRT